MTTATQQAPTYGRRDGDRIEANLEPSRRGNGGRSGPSPLRDPHQVARGLGWFSIGLGLAECAAPRSVARMIGLRDDDTNRNTLFAYGVREIASGIGILMGDRPVVPVWARVGGDVMDLAFLGRALRSDRSEKNRVAAATAAVLGVTLLDVMTGRSLGAESTAARGAADPGSKSGSRSPSASRRKSSTASGATSRTSRASWSTSSPCANWTTAGRAGPPGRRPAKRSNGRPKSPTDVPNERISWRSVGEADVPNFGTVRFLRAPGDRGAEVQVELRYDPPGGKLGAVVAKLFGEEPSLQVKSDLRRLKQVMETGEVVHSDASIHRGMHPAQPSGASANGGHDR